MNIHYMPEHPYSRFIIAQSGFLLSLEVIEKEILGNTQEEAREFVSYKKTCSPLSLVIVRNPYK